MEKLKNMKWYYWVLILGILGGLYWWFMVKGTSPKELADRLLKLEKSINAGGTATADYYLNGMINGEKATDFTVAFANNSPKGVIFTKPTSKMSMSERQALSKVLSSLNF